jgi:hypothetical protein
LNSAAAPTATFSTAIPTTDFDISSLMSSELASLYPSTNPYARACLSYNSAVDQCALMLATLTAPAAIESGATKCYCQVSSSMNNGAFDAIVSSCESYIRTAPQFTSLTETSGATILPKSIVCNGAAATATATGGTATATSGESTASGSVSGVASTAAANALPVGDLKVSYFL